MRLLVATLLLGALGCASGKQIARAGANRICLDSCTQAHQRCQTQVKAKPVGGNGAVGGFLNELEQTEALHACDAAYGTCNQHC
jgi:hypothetical protein